MPARGGLFGIVVIPEVTSTALEEDDAHFTRFEFATIVVTHVDLPGRRAPNSSGVRQPLRRRADRRSAPLGGRVVLVEDWTPPVHHLPLHVDRAWRSRMNHHAKR